MNPEILHSLDVGAVFKETESRAVDVCFSADSAAIGVGYEDGSVFVIDPETAKITKTHRSHKYGLSHFAFLNSDYRGGLAIATASPSLIVDHSIRIWDLNSNRFCRIFRNHENDISNISPHSCDGILLSSSKADGITNMWDMRLDTSVWRHEGGVGSVGVFDRQFGSSTCVVSNPSKRQILTFDSRILDRPLNQIQFNTAIDELVLFGNSHLLVGSCKLGTVTTISADTGKTISLYFMSPTQKFHLDISPCTNYALATTSTNSIDIWDIKSRIKIKSLDKHGGPPIAKFSPKHTLIASASIPIALWVPIHS